MRIPLGLLAACILAIGSIDTAMAHGGHDHDAPPAPIDANIAPRAEAASSDFEIVAVVRGTELEISLDSFRDNTPIENAQIEVDTPSGLLKPTHRGTGTYVAGAPFLAKPGKYDLAFSVSAGGKIDVLTATLDVPAKAPERTGMQASDAAKGTRAAISLGPLALGGMVLAAFAAGLAAARLFQRRRAAAVAIIGLAAMTSSQDISAQSAEAALIATPPAPVARDAAQRLADGSVFVPKAAQRILAIRTVQTAEDTHTRSVELPGRIIPDPNASGLVQASVGGRLSPPDGGFKPLGTMVKAGEVLAYVRPPLPSADATVQAQQARELDQQIAIVTRKVERLSAIQQVIAKSQLEDAQLELKGLKERRANLDRVNREPEPLRAPVDGVIASANAVAGQMAEPSSIIFQIIDPQKLWVEALAFEPQNLTSEATARISDGRQLKLTYLGTGLADRNQAIPVQFAVQGDARGLRPGQLLTVFARTSDVRKGIALPRTAVLRGGNGQTIIFEHTAAERFIPREVRVVGLDGSRVLVVSGIDAGKRVVTQGAELLDQIR